MVYFRGFADDGVCAMFDEVGTVGDPLDYNAARNVPAKTPSAHLDKVYFHSDFDYYELAAATETVSIPHPVLAGYTGPDRGVTDIPIFIIGQDRTTDIVLTTHGLGYVPRYMVALDGAVMSNGTVVQTEGSDGRFRSVSTYATTTQIILREHAYSTNLALSAISKSYEIMVFKTPTQDPAKPLFEFDGSHVQFGRGRIDSANKYLRQVLALESSFDIDLGATMDLDNGAVRVVSGGNVYSETGYGGSFVGPAYLPVGGVS